MHQTAVIAEPHPSNHPQKAKMPSAPTAPGDMARGGWSTRGACGTLHRVATNCLRVGCPNTVSAKNLDLDLCLPTKIASVRAHL
mmetsp:Transcript_12706/g.22971  ORF Transcript_12706/g.22971 Transcript_12706/m.22971 type:complete len:84 (-) Transcript_12706:610-861(-)